VTLWITTVVIFLLVRVTGRPVDVILPETATAEQRTATIKRLGLDRPLLLQYASHVAGLVTGDLGYSSTFRGNPLRPMPARRRA
jgi:ABC-type dipeptide/oligopeptide/nickel transport system permease component